MRELSPLSGFRARRFHVAQAVDVAGPIPHQDSDAEHREESLPFSPSVYGFRVIALPRHPPLPASLNEKQ
jgi:hypothetical protein